jgi:NDP-sugar pyrophosphorylase family protein
MGPLTNDIPKAIVKVAGKTLLEWAIERYNQSGISDIVIAVGWKGSMIEDFVSKSNIKVSIVHVPDYEIGPLQTFLRAIETFDGDFLLSPVDAMTEVASMMGIQTHHKTGDHEGFTLAIGSDVESGTPVEVNEKGLLTRIGAAGSSSESGFRSAMLLISNTRIRDQCRTALNDGKVRVAELLEQVIKNETPVRCYPVSHHWFDVDTLSDILAANQHFLQRGGFRETNSVFIPLGDRIEVGDSFTLKSNISLGKGTSLQGPVLIASDCKIGEDCKIGPNVTIDSKTTLSKGCEITEAVIFGESNLSTQSRVHMSVIYDSNSYIVEP